MSGFQRSRRVGRAFLRPALGVILVAGALQFSPVGIDPVSALPTTAPQLTQSSFVFENDDSVGGVDTNTQQAAGNAAISSVRQGERVTLRTQLMNTQGALASSRNLSLFYDRGDNIWSKVTASGIAPVTGSGTCTNTTFDCTTLDSTGTVGQWTSTAIAPNGTPWTAYYDATNTNLRVATRVGSGGTGCATAEWTCVTVDSTGTVGQYTSMAIDNSGNPWVSYYDQTNTNLKVAKYVGTGGTGCATTAWTCVTVDSANNVGQFSAIALDNAGNPWVSYINVTSADLRVARFVSSGGSGCAITAWTCTTVRSTGSIGEDTSIVIDSANKAWVSFVDSVNGDLYVANYVTSSGDCNSSAWDCGVIDNANSVGWFNSMAIAPDGTPWISYSQDTAGQLKVARLVGSGGSGCYLSAWTCEVVKGSNLWMMYSTSLAFDPAGNPWIAYRDDGAGTLSLARRVGSGGTGCATTAWACNTIDTTTNAGMHPSLAFGQDGSATISYQNANSADLRVAQIHRGGEMTAANALAGANGDVISESHADMTSVTNTANRDDADCTTAGATWNAGKWFTSDTATGVAIPAGTTTAQCTEVAFSIDTTNANANQTYRFVVATDDGWRQDKGKWRGPIAIVNYPTLTTATTTTQRFSKQATTSLPTTTTDLATHLDQGSSPRTSSTPCSQGYCAVTSFDATSDSITAAAGQRPAIQLADKPVSTINPPTFTWAGTSTTAPQTNAITVQVYRFGTTNAWETVTPSTNTCVTAGANATCVIKGTATAAASQYYQAGTAYYRVSQASAAGAETLKTNVFSPTNVSITPPPTASFTRTPASGPAPLNVSFNASSSSATSPATITNYAWDFGDSTTATGATTSHNYTTAGTYSATLTVTDSNGQTATTSQNVTVSASSTPPTASFTRNPTAGDAPLLVVFNASGSSATSPATITNYSWDFGDGGTGSGIDPQHLYTAAGTYTVTLTVTDSNAATDTESSTVTVSSTPQLQFVLTWNNEADLDLAITDPSGDYISFGNPGPNATGGTYLGDDNECGTPGPSGGAEATSWSTDPANGDYTISVDQYANCAGPNANWTLRIIVNGTVVQTQTGTGDGPDNITYTYTGA